MSEGMNTPASENKSEDERLKDVAEALVGLFITEASRFVLMKPGSTPFIMKSGKEFVPLTWQHMMEHVERKYAVAVYASPEGSKFICFDVDDGSARTVRDLIDLIEMFGISREYMHVSFSGKKGYHVEVFFDEPVELDRLRLFYEWVISMGGLDRRRVEYRPSDKQAIKLPLSIHYETGNVCWFVDRETLSPVNSHDPLFEIKQWPTMEFLARLHERTRGMRQVAAVKSEQPEYRTVDLEKSPDIKARFGWLTAMPLTAQGTRHNAMLKIAVYQRNTGASRRQCLSALLDWYNSQDKRLIRSSPEDVKRDAESLTDWAYGDKFVCSAASVRGVQVTMSRRDMDRVMAQRSLTGKKLLFAILAHDKANCNRISQARLAKMVGATEETVKRTLAAMAWEGIIEVREAKARKNGGQFHRQPNAYFPVAESARNVVDDRSDTGVEIDICELGEAFDEVFYRVIAGLYTVDEIIDQLKLREAGEYMRWLDRQRTRKEVGIG